MLKDISEFKIGDAIESYSKIRYKVISVHKQKKDSYSILKNLESNVSGIIATHNKNYCFKICN